MANSYSILNCTADVLTMKLIFLHIHFNVFLPSADMCLYSCSHRFISRIWLYLSFLFLLNLAAGTAGLTSVALSNDKKIFSVLIHFHIYYFVFVILKAKV